MNKTSRIVLFLFVTCGVSIVAHAETKAECLTNNKLRHIQAVIACEKAEDVMKCLDDEDAKNAEEIAKCNKLE